jgi:hypothetical protein
MSNREKERTRNHESVGSRYHHDQEEKKEKD